MALSAGGLHPSALGSTLDSSAGGGQQSAPSTEEKQNWSPPAPNPKDFDWIKLTSGEWLKGDIKVLRDDTLEFDSDNLDTLTVDWSDIEELHSPRHNTITLADRRTAVGTLLIRGDAVLVGTEDGELRFRREDLLSIVPGKPSEWNYWSGGLSIGLTTQTGNTEQITANGQLSIRRRSAFSRLTLNYIGNLGEVDGVQNVNNHRATARWDLFVSKRWFLTPLSLSYYSDRFANIEHQLTPAAGGGYHLIDRSNIKWDLALAVGLRYTKYLSASGGDSGEDSTTTVIPRTNLNWDITKDLEFHFSYKIEIGVPETKNTNHHIVAQLSIDLVGDFNLGLTFQWDRVGDPQPEADGRVPKSDDFRTSLGIGWEF
ncbi:MAG: DUF481 domain-containing protein [Deltaproteobacteria bacterium]|nr:MAG: DUF481 domain-containing protein [Deltaproteobacteria bacterium]